MLNISLHNKTSNQIFSVPRGTYALNADRWSVNTVNVKWAWNSTYLMCPCTLLFTAVVLCIFTIRLIKCQSFLRVILSFHKSPSWYNKHILFGLKWGKRQSYPGWRTIKKKLESPKKKKFYTFPYLGFIAGHKE